MRGRAALVAVHLAVASTLAGCRADDPVPAERTELRARSQAGPVEAPPGILLASGRVLPVAAGLDVATAAALGERAAGRNHLYVRVAPGMEPEAYGVLQRAGLALLDHLERDSYVGSLSASVDFGAPPFRGRVLWVGGIQPGDKIHRRLIAGPVADWDMVSGGARRRVLVTMHEDVSEADGAAALGRAGLRGEQIGGGTLWQVELEQAQIHDVAALDEVLAVTPGLEPRRYQNSQVRPSIGTDALQGFTTTGPSVSYTGLSGEGIRVGIVDLGIDQSHPDFSVLPGDSGCEPGQPARFYRTVPASDDHGTHVAAIVAGNGTHSVALADVVPGIGEWDVRGHAPRACLGEYLGLLAQITAHAAAVVVDGTDVFNHSDILHVGPEYMPIDRELDRMIRGGTMSGYVLPPRAHVFSAGNYGVCNDEPSYYPSQFAGYHSVGVSAKNAIVVGSIDVEKDELSQFSSLGPTFDGRVKPELVAPGAHSSHGASASCPPGLPLGEGILSAIPTINGFYKFMSGTSMSAPAVTGVIALMMEALENRRLGPSAGDLRPSTWRALLVQTADDLARGKAPTAHTSVNPDTADVTTYPRRVDHATGWGKVDAVAACAAVVAPARWYEGFARSTGAVYEECVEVPLGARELVVTLAWDDAPDETIVAQTSPRLVNDLDLELVSPDGQTYLPWVVPTVTVGPVAVIQGIDVNLVPDLKPALRVRDDRNNLEQVRVSGPAVGTWRIRVRAYYLAGGKTQPFSVATSHAVSGWFFRRPQDLIPTVCQRYPWLCGKLRSFPEFEELGGTWTWSPGAVLPLSFLRASAGLPLEGPGPAWGELPGFELTAGALPGGSRLLLIDDAGEVRGMLEAPSSSPLRLPRRSPGEEFMLLLVDNDGRPHEGTATITLELTELEEFR